MVKERIKEEMENSTKQGLWGKLSAFGVPQRTFGNLCCGCGIKLKSACHTGDATGFPSGGRQSNGALTASAQAAGSFAFLRRQNAMDQKG